MELNPTFCRRLLVCYLIEQYERPSVPEIMRLTGWPRRTIQDILKALPGMGVELFFQQQGRRNNDGYYVLKSWGAIDKNWVTQHADALHETLELSVD